MIDEDAENVAALRNKLSKYQTGKQRRHDLEMKGVHHIDRRGMRTPPHMIRNVQLNIKVSQHFRSRLEAYSATHKISATEALVRAFNAYIATTK